ncbi:MAG: hypothetical protein ABR529_02800 [Actinomycetota bacterium]
MSAGEIVITAFIGFVSAGLGSLIWSRLGRLEDEMSKLGRELRVEIRGCASKEDLEIVRVEIRGCASKEDLETFRSETRSETRGVRSDIAALRSDLTQVAPAVGAHPRASEG